MVVGQRPWQLLDNIWLISSGSCWLKITPSVVSEVTMKSIRIQLKLLIVLLQIIRWKPFYVRLYLRYFHKTLTNIYSIIGVLNPKSFRYCHTVWTISSSNSDCWRLIFKYTRSFLKITFLTEKKVKKVLEKKFY